MYWLVAWTPPTAAAIQAPHSAISDPDRISRSAGSSTKRAVVQLPVVVSQSHIDAVVDACHIHRVVRTHNAHLGSAVEPLLPSNLHQVDDGFVEHAVMKEVQEDIGCSRVRQDVRVSEGGERRERSVL